ncbi:hypothetical protein LWE61_08065 [Sphingobium sufflavum]|uniref:hypothetical protein n=1 Tax=Sphingobium sufflavum TaxID=1129547 RepID=UPI001F204E18|nr:hypothetical protein [Sphingobium sufflavum]MCE7796516.1 hypothetical protein [Sphingobium sufflavum]
MTNSVTFVSLAIATIAIPPAANRDIAGSTHLVGAGLLIATRDGDQWRFSSEAATIAAGEKEQNLLLWLADRLPIADTLIGWHIDPYQVPALINAAADADPAIAHHFMVRLARALRNNVVDLSIDSGGAAAPAFSEVAQDAAIAAPSMEPEVLMGAWSTGRLDAVRHDLATEAVGTWLLFLRQAQAAGMDAEDATRAWMHRRHRVRSVKNAPGAA